MAVYGDGNKLRRMIKLAAGERSELAAAETRAVSFIAMLDRAKGKVGARPLTKQSDRALQQRACATS